MIVPVGELTVLVTAFVLSVFVTVAVNCTVPDGYTVALEGVSEIETGGTTVTVAVLKLAGFETLVAVITTVSVVVTDGAVYSPPLVIVPRLAVHVTELLVKPVSVALNCCVPPGCRLTVAGLTTMLEFGAITVTVAGAELDGFSTLVAVTVTV